MSRTGGRLFKEIILWGASLLKKERERESACERRKKRPSVCLRESPFERERGRRR